MLQIIQEKSQGPCHVLDKGLCLNLGLIAEDSIPPPTDAGLDLENSPRNHPRMCPEPASEDPETIKKSLKLIENIKGVEYIATAHGGVLQIPKK